MKKRDILLDAKRIVVKVGTTTLTYDNGFINLKRIEKLARVLADISNSGKEVVLVSSGAIAVGANSLGLNRVELTLPEKQASASIGQTILMKIYQKMFEEYNKGVSQILITKDIMDNPESRLNAENTINTLIDMNIIPIVNENDTISTYEINFGDNDNLSATVANLIDADLLILLSDIDGLYTDDPKKNPNAEFILEVDEVTKEIEKLANGSSSVVGTGGMITKISAAKKCINWGIDAIIGNGKNPEVVYDILEANNIGTFFVGKRKSIK